MGPCPLSLGNWAASPAERPCRSGEGGTARKDRQLQNHLLRGLRIRPSVCLQTGRFEREKHCSSSRRTAAAASRREGGAWDLGPHQDDHRPRTDHKQTRREGRGQHVACPPSLPFSHCSLRSNLPAKAQVSVRLPL